MKDGNWIAIDKNLAKYFPDRKYSEIEAAFSLTLDYDNSRNVTVSGYAKLWQWSRSKVRSFLDSMGIEIIYPEDTTKNQKQKGQIKKQIKDRSETEKGQIRMVDTKCLENDENRKKTDQGQIKDRSKDTTSKPINNPNPNPLKNNKSKKTFSDDSVEMKLSKYLFRVLLKSEENKPEPNYQKWCLGFDHILRIDKKSAADIQKIINYAHDPKNSTDKFSWIPNLRSPKKIREHFTTILLQSNKKPIFQNKEKTLSEIAEEMNNGISKPFDIELTDYQEV